MLSSPHGSAGGGELPEEGIEPATLGGRCPAAGPGAASPGVGGPAHPFARALTGGSC